MPWVETVETKQSFAFTRILSKHPKTTVKEIYNGVKNAVSRLEEMKLLVVKTPVDVEIRYQRTDGATHSNLIDMYGNSFGFEDGYTRVGTLKCVEDIILRTN